MNNRGGKNGSRSSVVRRGKRFAGTRVPALEIAWLRQHPARLDRSKVSRKSREKAVAAAFKNGKLAGVTILEDWELAYRKECFYYGIRALLELERKGRTRL
jgi:hypothetical protein